MVELENHKENSRSGLLVAVDFSDHSREALRFAAHQADCMNSELTVLHVVHDPGEMPGYYAKLVKPSKMLRLEDMAKKLLKQFVKDTLETYPENRSLKKATELLVVGLPVSRIIEVVNQRQPEQLVMGSQGRSGLKHLMLGSKAEQVLRLCPVPVTVVKAAKPDQS